MSSSSSSDQDTVDHLAEEFVARHRRGEHPDIAEYTQRFPRHAEAIRDLFPALVLIEQVKPGAGEPTGVYDAMAATDGRRLERLGDYRILRELGRGGMGVIYEAEQESLGRRVALKVLSAGALIDPQQVRRFEREARAAAKLHHTNIVPVFGVGQQDGHHYYVMQLIPGLGLDLVLEDLRRLRHPEASPEPAAHDRHEPSEWPAARSRSRLTAAEVARSLLTGRFAGDEPIPPGETVTDPVAGGAAAAPPSLVAEDSPAADSSSVALPGSSALSALSDSDRRFYQGVARIGIQVAEALEYANRQGVLHRDVKPSNLLLDNRGNVWVADFGLAKTAEPDDLTHTGDILGTIRYMAPERFAGRCDARSDVYSLGLTLYELVALRPAYQAADRHALVERVVHEEPAPLRRLAPAVPRDLETIIAKATVREPAARYATAAALAEDLQRFVEDRPIRARRAGLAERAWRWSRRNPAVASLGAGVAALLIVVTVGSTLVAWTFAEKARIESRLRTDADQARGTAVAKANELESSLYVNRVNRAYREWEANNVDLAERLLDDCPAARRGWEWHFVKRLCHLERLPLRGHTAGVLSLAFSPDGSWVASGAGAFESAGSDDEAELNLWDAVTGRRVLALPGLKGAVRGLAFSPDGARLAAASEFWYPERGGRLTLWNLATGRVVFDRPESGTAPLCAAFSPDGKTLAVGSGGFLAREIMGHVTLRDAATGDELFRLPGQPGGVSSVAFSPDGKTLAAAGAGLIELWDLGSRAKVHALRADQSFVYDVAFSPDGRLATGGYDGTIKLWDPATGEAVLTLYGHTGKVSGLAFSPDGKTLASSSEDMSVRLWDPMTGRELAVFRGHTSLAHDVAFSRDGRTIASASSDGMVKLWDVRTSRPVVFREHTAWVETTSFSPDGKLVVSGAGAMEGVDNTVRLWDPTTGEPLRTFPGHVAAFFSPEGRSLFTYTTDDKWHRFDVATGRELEFFPKGFPPPDAGWIGFGISPDGRHVRTRLADKMTQQIWDVPTGKLVATLRGHREPVIGLVYNSEYTLHPFSPDGRFLASLAAPLDAATGRFKPGRELKLWDVPTGREILTVRDPTWSYRSVEFSPDGRRIAVFSIPGIGGPEETVRILDTTTGGEVLRLRGPDRVYAVAFSPDGKRIATDGGDRTIRLWDALTGEEVLTLHGHTADVISLAFSPDGHRLVSGSIDWTARVWDATPLPGTPP